MRKLDAKEIRFCELIVSGMEPASAYIEAGFPGPSGMHAVTQSKKMLADPDVKDYLEQLNSSPASEEDDDIDTDRITKDFVIKELWKSYKKAVLLGQMPAAMKALEMIGAEKAGMFKKEQKKGPGTGKSLKDMSLEELQREVLNLSNETRLPRA